MDEILSFDYTPILFVGLGLLLVILAVLYKPENSKLKQTGTLVEGIIFELGYDNTSASGMQTSSIKDKVTVRFVTKKHEWITKVVDQGFSVSYTGQYKIGEAVRVYYDESNPTNFFVDSKQSALYGRILFGAVGLLFILTGLYQLMVL